MAEVNLPGVSSTIDVKSIIDKLVKVENKKLDRLEEVKDVLDREKSAWSNLGNRINSVQETAHSLYGFRSPFDDKIAVSSRGEILTATTSRIAEPSRSIITVEQAAKSERLLSDSIPSSTVLEPATLRLRVGETDSDIIFNGGRMEDLARAINDQAGEYLNAKIARDTEESEVLILETKEPGLKNRLSVTDAETLGYLGTIGVFGEEVAVRVDTSFSEERITPVGEGTRYLLDDVLLLEPNSSVRFDLSEPVNTGPQVYLRVQVRAEENPVEEKEELGWPELGTIGTVTVGDIELKGGSQIAKAEAEETVPAEPVVVTDDAVIGIETLSGKVESAEAVGLGPDLNEYRFKLQDITDRSRIDKILFINRNTARRITFARFDIIDTSEREGAVPKHLMQEAANSVIHIDGVRIERGSNEIDDAIEGVTLSVKKPSKEEIILDVDRDYEKITQRIVDLIDQYNKLLEYINEQARVVPTGRLDEGTEAGLLAGDITVAGLKNKLQTLMMNPYPTESGKELSLMAQIGVSMGSSGSSWEEIRGGYLQVDEDTFIEAVRNHPDTIEMLFGSDTNRDSVIDNGLAYVMDKTLKAYTEPRNGIVSYHIRNIDTKIRDQDKKIEDWKDHIDDYRSKLERDFTVMQQAMNELEQSQKSLENFSNQLKKR